MEFKKYCTLWIGVGACGKGARQFVENHFADTTIGRIRLLVNATFRQVRHLVENKKCHKHVTNAPKGIGLV